MTTNPRHFFRDFAPIKATVRKGKIARKAGKEGQFLFTVSCARKSLISAAKGKIGIQADLTKPTLVSGAWKASL